jgi:hypothetical protein
MFEPVSQPRATLRKDVNALRSGGPRTEEGKAASSRNSLTHGLTARQAVISGENQSDFDHLHQNLVNDRKPQGELETQLTGEIAACMWRLARARDLCLENRDAGICAGLEAAVGRSVSYGLEACRSQSCRRQRSHWSLTFTFVFLRCGRVCLARNPSAPRHGPTGRWDVR